MASERKLAMSATMTAALGEVGKHGGKLVRHPGGFWSYDGCPARWDGLPTWWVDTGTVNALERRGRITFTEWKEGRNRRFPIEATVVNDHALS
jgi:hypothetical protein